MPQFEYRDTPDIDLGDLVAVQNITIVPDQRRPLVTDQLKKLADWAFHPKPLTDEGELLTGRDGTELSV